jgi:putative hydrolase of the HAD superfamily
VRTAILSNSFVGAREKEHEAYGFTDLVDDIVYSHEVGLSKPDAAVYALTCDRLGVAPDEVVFVDDVAVNVAAARALGMAGVLFTDTASTIAAVRARLDP